MDNYINLSDKAVIDLFIFLRADNSSLICGSIVNKLPIKSISIEYFSVISFPQVS